jgi:hypothetical protein
MNAPKKKEINGHVLLKLSRYSSRAPEVYVEKDHAIAEVYIAIPSAIPTFVKGWEFPYSIFPCLHVYGHSVRSFDDRLPRLPKDFLSFT